MKSLITLALSSPILATIHTVTVGPGLVYSPDTITDAASGDIISFEFGSGHNVVSGSFDSPCQPSGGIYSGDPSDGDVFSVTLNGTDPLWIYCSVPHHCEGGMVMVVNPSSDQTLDAYKSAAKSASGSSQPDSVGGGVFGAVSDSSASSASASASSAMSSASTSASAAASSASASMSSVTSSLASSASALASSASSSAASATSSGVAAAGALATGAPGAVGVVMAAAGLLALL